MISRSAGTWSPTIVGSPIPRLTYQPSGISRATRAAMAARSRGLAEGCSRSLMSVSTCSTRILARRLGRRAPVSYFNDTIDENSRRDDFLGREIAQRHAMLRLRDRHPRGHRHDGIEVPPAAAIGEVAPTIRPPGLDQRYVGMQGPLQKIGAAIELADLLALRERRADGGGREEAGNAGTGGADTLGERALRHQLELDPAGAEQLLEDDRAARETADELADAPAIHQPRQPGLATPAGVVRHDREVARALLDQSLDQSQRMADRAEAADQDGRAVLDIGERLRDAGDELVDHLRPSRVS